MTISSTVDLKLTIITQVLERHKVFFLATTIQPSTTKCQCAKVLINAVKELLRLLQSVRVEKISWRFSNTSHRDIHGPNDFVWLTTLVKPGRILPGGKIKDEHYRGK